MSFGRQGDENLVEVAVTIKDLRNRSIGVTDGTLFAFVPRSQIYDIWAANRPIEFEDLSVNKTVTIEIPEWLAKEKGFI
jgi:hypothetical protein